MTAAQIHLALNHLPVLLLPVGLLLLAVGLGRRSLDLKRAGLAFLVAASLAGIPVYLTGEGAEEIIEGRVGVNDADIHEHEEAAEWGFIAVLVTGALAALAFFLTRGNDRFRLAPVLVLLVGLVASVILFRVAHLGGLIRHPELMSGPPVSEVESERD